MIILGLGGNLGDPAVSLQQAVDALKQIMRLTAASRIYQTAPLLPENAPEEWNIPFLNMAVSGETALAPEALLKEIKRIEQEMGREESARWAPRVIDIDILAWDDRSYQSETLTIPHASLLERDFALLPLIDITPDWQCNGQTARDWAEQKGIKENPSCHVTLLKVKL